MNKKQPWSAKCLSLVNDLWHVIVTSDGVHSSIGLCRLCTMRNEHAIKNNQLVLGPCWRLFCVTYLTTYAHKQDVVVNGIGRHIGLERVQTSFVFRILFFYFLSTLMLKFEPLLKLFAGGSRLQIYDYGSRQTWSADNFKTRSECEWINFNQDYQ